MLKDNLAGFLLKKEYIYLQVPPLDGVAYSWEGQNKAATSLQGFISFIKTFLSNCYLEKANDHTSTCVAFKSCCEIQKEISTDIFCIWTESFLIYSVYNRHGAVKASVLQFYLLRFN